MAGAIRRLVGLVAVAGLAVTAGPGGGSASAPAPPVVAPRSAALALGWAPIAGPYDVTPPEVLPPGQYVIQMGLDGQPYYHQSLGGQWSEPNPLGGQFLSTVVPVITFGAPQSTVTQLAGIGPDLAMWWQTWGSAWSSLGGAFVSSPVGGQFQGTTYLFGVGTDDAVWYGSPLGGWTSLGGVVVSDLTLLTDGARLWVVGIGNDGAMWTRGFDGSTWTAWQTLGGLSRSYGVSAQFGGAGYLFMIGNDDAVWYQQVTSAGGWSGWIPLGGKAVTPPAAAADANGGLNVFVIGTDLAMWSQRATAAGGWQGWQHLGGAFISAPGAGTNQVFGIGLNEDLYVATYQ